MTSIPPSTEKFGTREFVRLLIAALREYLRHKENIDQDVGTSATAAIMTLVDIIDTLLALNPPGPE